MSAPNSELFNRQVLNALTFLYGNFPSLVTVDNRALSSGTDTEIALIEYGTIIWLYRNGIVSGSLLENKPIGGAIDGALPSAAITEAQLTAKALRALDTRTDLNQQFLKVLIVDQSTDKNVVASLLVQTLLRV